jgi:hypothetical protein
LEKPRLAVAPPKWLRFLYFLLKNDSSRKMFCRILPEKLGSKPERSLIKQVLNLEI